MSYTETPHCNDCVHVSSDAAQEPCKSCTDAWVYDNVVRKHFEKRDDSYVRELTEKQLKSGIGQFRKGSVASTESRPVITASIGAIAGRDSDSLANCLQMTPLRIAALRTCAPPIRHERLSIPAQIDKMDSELMEVNEALNARNLEHVAIEVWDVITACSTLLSRLEETGVNIAAAGEAMYAKNAARDYYCEPGAGIHVKKNSVNRY